MKQVLKLVVAAGCVYELVALPDRTDWHTISHLCNEAVRHVSWRKRMLAWSFMGALVFHLIGLERPIVNRLKGVYQCKISR